MGTPSVCLVISSQSDLLKLDIGLKLLDEFKIKKEIIFLSLGKNPLKIISMKQKTFKNYDMIVVATSLEDRLIDVIASGVLLPVIWIPLTSKDIKDYFVNRPQKIPVINVPVNAVKEAFIIVAQILSLKYPKLKKEFKKFIEQTRKKYVKPNI